MPWSAHGTCGSAGDTRVDDAGWAYDDALPAAGPIAGRIAFYSEEVEVAVDGGTL
jgi:uncharacterized protein (DUF427 family)